MNDSVRICQICIGIGEDERRQVNAANICTYCDISIMRRRL